LVDSGHFEINVSVPLVLEYEDVLSRPEFGFSTSETVDFVDYLCSIANRHNVYYLWRPYLNDPKDDMVLELAVTAGCSHVVTFNISDFSNVLPFGIRAVRPGEFLQVLEEMP